jgi:hypothetical protein
MTECVCILGASIARLFISHSCTFASVIASHCLVAHVAQFDAFEQRSNWKHTSFVGQCLVLRLLCGALSRDGL